MKENKLYVVHTNRGYWGGHSDFTPQLRQAKIYTSLLQANKTAERFAAREPIVLEVFLSLVSEGEAEVAREIFAEIEKCWKYNFDGITEYEISKEDFDELKKKYTGGE